VIAGAEPGLFDIFGSDRRRAHDVDARLVIAQSPDDPRRRAQPAGAGAESRLCADRKARGGRCCAGAGGNRGKHDKARMCGSGESLKRASARSRQRPRQTDFGKQGGSEFRQGLSRWSHLRVMTAIRGRASSLESGFAVSIRWRYGRDQRPDAAICWGARGAMPDGGRVSPLFSVRQGYERRRWSLRKDDEFKQFRKRSAHQGPDQANCANAR